MSERDKERSREFYFGEGKEGRKKKEKMKKGKMLIGPMRYGEDEDNPEAKTKPGRYGP